jgi:serine/threonine protein kinase/tetratricopeptide (TPR) repeat protein
MNTRPPSVETILAAAVDIADVAQRRAYVAQACAGDAALQRRVEALIANHFQAGSFLERPAAVVDADAAAAPPAEGPGTVIGPYKLLEQIGEGGMGLVFMAEQTQPVRRRVALKILKPGMDSRQVIARFEAERQALALMDHPNIAKVFDAGTTGMSEPEALATDASTTHRPVAYASGSGGRPYFVMELVEGVPITEFCDQRRLTPRQRLELFVVVCQAVQHAHTKGIIHRDLKPSNVLVTLHDTAAVPKVIDFGIAKATSQPLTERTLFTHFGQMIGTPLYMSPEQAEMNALDVDTRSNVYSLGVLLYELLTGTTPFESETLKKVGLDEMRRIIREDEPPRPSQRISTVAAQVSSTVSERRGMDGRRLRQLLQGELDWIVMKALEKDRDRRYETASAFAADVHRYLNDEPVEACPPSRGYRLRKFARRNRRVLATAGVIALVLVAAVVVSGWQAMVAWDAQEQAENDRDRAKTAETQAATAAAKAQAAFQEANKERKIAQNNEQRANAERKRAEEVLREALRLTGRQLDLVREKLLGEKPSFEDAAEDLQRIITVLEKVDADHLDDDRHHRNLAVALQSLGDASWRIGKLQQAEDAFGRAAVRYGKAAEALQKKMQTGLGAINGMLEVHVMAQLADLLTARGRSQEAEALLRQALAIFDDLLAGKGTHPADHPILKLTQVGPLLCLLAKIRADRGQAEEAADLYRQAMGLMAGDKGPNSLAAEGSTVIRELAWYLASGPQPALRDPARAVEILEKQLERIKPVTNPSLKAALGVARYRAGDWKGAVAELQTTAKQHFLCSTSAWEGAVYFHLAMAYWKLGDKHEGQRCYADGLAWMNRCRPHDPEICRFRDEAAAMGLKK